MLSIFVNPIQFGPNEDFDKYPRDTERDLKVAENAGCDFVFMPSAREMYPHPIRTNVQVSELTARLCGASRPGHFDGVATVVSKLFNIVQPDRAYFGLKDAQQTAVITQMVNDLNIDVKVVPCPIIREEDGLALSSRNVYLSDEERRQALVLNRALRQAEKELAEGRGAEQVRDGVIREINKMPLAQIDYVELLTYPGLQPVQHDMQEPVLVAVAVKFGKTRLIDNIITRFS